jgi:hypothetical protein
MAYNEKRVKFTGIALPRVERKHARKKGVDLLTARLYFVLAAVLAPAVRPAGRSVVRTPDSRDQREDPIRVSFGAVGG